jgi:hypothetical protein
MVMSIVPDDPPPVDRGELLTPEQVSQQLLNGTLKAVWVRRHLRRVEQRYNRNVVRYYRRDAEDELARLARENQR